MLQFRVLFSQPLIGPRHDDGMDRAQPQALPLQLGADQKPQKIECDWCDSEIVEGVERIRLAEDAGTATRAADGAQSAQQTLPGCGARQLPFFQQPLREPSDPAGAQLVRQQRQAGERDLLAHPRWSWVSVRRPRPRWTSARPAAACARRAGCPSSSRYDLSYC